MLLPAAVRPYAADVDGTDSRVRCAIVLNGSKELHIQLCGRLKRGLFGRNQLLADGDVLCVALHQPDGDVPLFDSDATAMRMCWMTGSRPRRFPCIRRFAQSAGMRRFRWICPLSIRMRRKFRRSRIPAMRSLGFGFPCAARAATRCFGEIWNATDAPFAASSPCSISKPILILSAAPVASAEAKTLLSVATERFQRAPRGG